MYGLHLADSHVDQKTGVSSTVYYTDQRGALRIWNKASVWSATDEDGSPIPGVFDSAEEALENAEAYTNFQYDD